MWISQPCTLLRRVQPALRRSSEPLSQEFVSKLDGACSDHLNSSSCEVCMANTVKIVRFHKTGPAEVLQFDDLPMPEPGPGEIRLRVKALGLNRAEIMR